MGQRAGLTLLEKRKSLPFEGIRTWDCPVAIPAMLTWLLFVGVKPKCCYEESQILPVFSETGIQVHNFILILF